MSSSLVLAHRAGTHKFNRIVIVGGNVVERARDWQDPQRDILELCRRRFLRALLVAFPAMNDIFRYGSKL